MGIILALKVSMSMNYRRMKSAEARILEAGFEDIIILKDFSYDSALVGISEDNRAIYDFNKMVEWLMYTEDFNETEAIEWIEYNTIRSLPYAGEYAPIVAFEEDYPMLMYPV